MDGQNDSFSYDEAVDRIAEKYGVPKALYKKMLGQESGDNDNAVSPVGASTAWQIMPGTARGLGYDPEEIKREPLKAAEGGLRILRDNYKQFREYAENEKHAWMMAVGGYHTNPKNILKDIKRGGYGLPNTSDGLITTKNHVLKIFDGLTSDLFDRSPLGSRNAESASLNSSPDQPRAVSVNPDDLPTVSLSPLAKQTLKNQKPLEQVEPPTNQTFNNPVAPIVPKLPLPPVNQLPPVQDNPMIVEPAPNVQTPGIVQPPAPTKNPEMLQEPVIDDGITGYPNRRPNTSGYDFERSGKLKLEDGSELELIKDEINRYEPTSFRFRDKNGQIFTANVEDDGETGKISLSPEIAKPNQSATVAQLIPEKPTDQSAPDLDSEYKTYAAFVKSQNKQPMTFEKFQKLVAETPDLQATATARLDAPLQQTQQGDSPVQGKELENPTNYVPTSADAYRNEVYANKPFAKVYRQKPTWQQVIDDSVRDAYGNNFNEVSEVYKRITGNNLLEPNNPEAIQADIDQYWNPKTGEYDVSAQRNPIYREARDIVEAYNKGGESAVRELVAKPVDGKARMNKDQRLTRNDDELRELARANVSANAFIPGFTTTDADIETEYQRLKSIELSEDEAQDYAERGRFLKENPFEGGSPDIGVGLYRGLGGLANIVAGVARPLASLGLIEDAAYQEMSKLGQGATIFANAAKHQDALGEIGDVVGQASIEVPKYIAMSALPGGAVAVFGLDSSLQSAGRGETLRDVGKETIKGAILGGIFQGAGKLSQMAEKGTLKRLLPAGDIAKVEAGALEGNFSSNVGKRVLVSKLFGEGVRIGSVGSGVMALELAAGEPVDEALKKAAVMTLFDVVMHGKKYGEIKDLAGKVFRVSKNGKTADVTVTPTGEVRLLKGNVPDRAVEAEFNADKVIDVELDAKGVYRPKGDTTPIRETAIKRRNPQLETGLQTSKAGESASLTKPPSATVAPSAEQGLIKPTIPGEVLKPSQKPIELPESSLKSESVAPSPEQQTKLQTFTEKLETQGGQVTSAKLNADGNIHVEWKRQNDASSREATIFKGGEMEGSLSGQKDYVQDLIKSDTSGNSPNMPEAPKTVSTRRSLDAERLSVLDKKRADIIDSEFNQVSGKAVSELIDNAKIEYKNGILYTNAEAAEILRQADYVAFSDADGSNFYGRYLNPKNSERIEKALDITFGGTRFTDRARQIKLKRFIGEYRRARQSSELQDVRQVVTATKRVPYGLKAARQEETAHGKDYAVGFEHRVSSNIFQSDGTGRRAMRHLKRTAYNTATKEVLGREVGAKIWLDTATKDLNISDAEVNHLRDLYTRSLKQRGKASKDIEKGLRKVSRSARNYLQENKNYEQSGIEPTRGKGLHSGRDRGRSGASESIGTTEVSGTLQEDRRGRVTGKSKLKELPLFEQKYIERNSEGDKDLAEKVAGEVLHSKSTALSNKMTVGDFAIDLTNMPKALKASVDLSAAGRQGLIAAIPHPIIASRSFGKQLGSLVSANYHKKFIEALENHPFREMAEKSGLYLSSLTDGSVNQREEQFMSRILGDDAFFKNTKAELARKGVTFPVRASERAYSTFLDDLRINVFADLARQVHVFNERNGITKQELGKDAYNAELQKQIEGLAKFVNYSTGRGSLGRFESAGEFLNIPFFSARYWASRFQVMNPAFYASLPPGARKAVMKDFGIFLGAMVSIFTLLKLSGADITVNPFSPDFLKLRVGQYSYDLSGGMVQQIRYLAQTTINIGTGEVQKALSGTGRYIRSKLAPVPSSLYSLGTGTNFIGEPVSVKGEAIGLISPISVEQVYEGAEKDGLLGVLQSSWDIFGIGTTRYDNSLEVGEKMAEAERRLAGAKTKEEEQEIYTEVKAWRDLYYRAKKQPGELPPYPGRAEEEEPEEEFIKDDIGEPEEKRDIKVPLSEMIKFYDEKNKTLFSFAKDELESLIIQRAEYLNMRGRLTEKDLKEVNRIIPEYEPLEKPHPGVDHRPDKLKKRPLQKINKDYPKPPKPPRIP